MLSKQAYKPCCAEHMSFLHESSPPDQAKIPVKAGQDVRTGIELTIHSKHVACILTSSSACFLMHVHRPSSCASGCTCDPACMHRKRGVRSARGRPPKRVKQATPPVNEMREKLRSAAAVDTPSPDPAAAQEPEHAPIPGAGLLHVCTIQPVSLGSRVIQPYIDHEY